MSVDSQRELIDEEPAAANGVSAKEAAESVLLWAKQNHLLAKGPAEDGVDDDGEAEFVPQQMFEAQAVKTILRKRAINLVAYNEAERKVIIFTQGRLTKSERKLLPFRGAGGVRVEYVLGGVAQVRGSPPAPEAYAPYSLHNGKICCGSSIHPVNCLGAGTFGALVKDAEGRLLGLTNNHVSGACNCAAPGLPILCPGPIDANEESISPFTIGRHLRLLPINEGIPENIDISKNCDVALFEVEDPDQVSSMQGDKFDTPISTTTPVGGMRVEKFGRTTGHTTGTVLGTAASPLPVGYSIKEYGISKSVFFDDVVIVQGEGDQPFSKAGDSGSLVIGIDAEGERQAVGLVFAGNEQRGLSFILPLPSILHALEVELVYGHNV